MIHHYARRQRADLAGRVVRASSPQGRFADGAAALDGHVLADVEAYGKHLLYRFPRLVHVHLGMAGKWFPTTGEPRASVRLRLAGPDATWDLVAPIRCELWNEEDWIDLRATLGPDPLRDDADPAAAWQRLHRSKLPIGAALLEQRIIAGIGNVIRSELLFELGVDPRTPAADVTRRRFTKLWNRLVEVMQASATRGRIVFTTGRTRHVYKRDACGRCGTAIAIATIGGRTAYACPRCQR